MDGYILAVAQSRVDAARVALTVAQLRHATLAGEAEALRINYSNSFEHYARALRKKGAWERFCENGTCVNALSKLNLGRATQMAMAKIKAYMAVAEFQAAVEVTTAELKKWRAKQEETAMALVETERLQSVLTQAEAELEQLEPLIHGVVDPNPPPNGGRRSTRNRIRNSRNTRRRNRMN